MATMTEHPPMAPSTFDQEIDSFLNLEQLAYAEPVRSKTTQPSIQNTEFVASVAPNTQSPIVFQGPSHQYDEHKQQTGLPPGALAQTMNFNGMNGMGFGSASPGFPMSADMMSTNSVKREDPSSLDFNTIPTRNPSDMDLESDNMGAGPAFYFSPNPNKNQFVDPNALGGHETVPMGPSTQVGRMYPGMHQQQAAKAAQLKHHEMLRQQQMQQQQQQRGMDEHMQHSAPPLSQPRNPNPVVDERISRLLQQMRQAAGGSPDDSPSPSGMPQMTKAKKDEQDMDADERLLASEEGKKLTSKERRQLRNKVSARAFRSRRKEYIGQLEGEVAARTNEAHDLRLQNRTLYEENSRLTDLARMLLSSPHFSHFLEEMNANGLPLPSQSQQSQPQVQQPQPPAMTQAPMQSSMPKEANSSHGSQEFAVQQPPQPGMVMMPHQGLDVSAMGLATGGWNSGIDMNYGNASVFAVLEVPEPPAIDTDLLTCKSSGIGSSFPHGASSKDEAPMMELSPVVDEPKGDIGVENPDIEIDESDPAFSLFVNSPPTTTARQPLENSFSGIRLDKSAPTFELIVENESRSAVDQFALLCQSMEEAFQPKLASLRLGALYNKAFRGVIASSRGRAPIFLPRLYSTTQPTAFEHKGPTLNRFAPHVRRSKHRLNPAVTQVPPQPAERDTSQDIDPGTYLLRAPAFKRRTRNYLLYNPTLHKKFSGLDFLPGPTVGNEPMKFYFQVVTTPTADTPGTTVLLHFPDKRYFFGQCSEGTQRACTERGIKLSYLTDIFLTGRMEWRNTGGLVGVILTLADGLASSNSAFEKAAREKEARRMKNGAPPQSPKKELKQAHGAPYAIQDGEVVAQRGSLTIHGARNLSHTLATARRFVFRKGMPVYTKEYDAETMAKRTQSIQTEHPFETPSWADNNIKVWAMPVRPATSLTPTASRQPSPPSPRKRSLDEYEERNVGLDPLDEHTKNQIMRQTVINDMFNSTWRLDALTETPLAEVKMPAVMFVRNPETKDLEKYSGPLPGSGEPLPDINVLVRQPWPGALVEKLPPANLSHEAISYVVRNHDIRGKFDPKKAKDFGVPEGPEFSKLSKGESVISVDGKTITSEMVLGPPRLGKGLAIIDLPSPEYVDGLVNRPEWNSPAVATNLEAFIWIIGPGVGDHPRLHEFVAKMSHCKHTVSSSDYCPNYLSLASVAGSSIRMAQLRNENFPVPVHDNVTLPQPGTCTFGREIARIPSFDPIQPGLIIDMEPSFNLNRSETMQLFNTSQMLEKMPRAVENRMRTTRKRIDKEEFQQKLESFQKDLPGADAEIITLGTGSSAPSKYRNVSSTLVNVPGVGYYLLDAGENTLGQLKRVFEPEQLKEVLQNLRMIWISHLHADHHLGTATVIKAWFEENYPNGIPHTTAVERDMAKILGDKRLFVVSEENMIGWLEEYASVENYGFGKLVPLAANPNLTTNGAYRTELIYRHCNAQGLYPGHETDSNPQTTSLRLDDEESPLTPLLRNATGLSNLLATKVNHCRGAMAVSLCFADGFKVSFSGDCRPSPSFAAIGRGSTVLIHEATFQNNMHMSAVAKKHSTIAEALDVGRMMEARSILLTHFSQRYQKVAHLYQTRGKRANPDRDDVAEQPAAQSENPDVPDDEPIDAACEDQAPVAPLAPSTSAPGPLNAPVVVAFDYMRVRVRDMLFAQAYAPAIEKLIDLLERASIEEAEQVKLEIEREQAARAEAKRGKKKNKKGKKDEPVAAPAPLPAAIDEPKVEKRPSRSVWSASESESGWDTSGSESENMADGNFR
ncbi:hypothetical protein FE257_003415 [Aspergillus nanangensis]|uniref:ribonuclease Z n=1 Tax=Aspergillus nanangensis TaxID=2582783 RepID=A0AAD4CBP5_ASPNN|nr:hypothetical protein FE257_003415 [Aspergillus nanangensis]